VSPLYRSGRGMRPQSGCWIWRETDPGVNQLGVKQLKDKFGLESTEFRGRVIAALYEDPDLLALSGKTLINAEIAEHYGVKDLDDYEPRSLRATYGGPHAAFDRQSEVSYSGTS
jgi:hypothetical protein